MDSAIFNGKNYQRFRLHNSHQGFSVAFHLSLMKLMKKMQQAAFDHGMIDS
jgi:hypothetical protein